MAEASLTSLEMTAIGAVSGTVEVCIMQPTVAVKNAIQEGRPIPRAPAGLYRGLLVNAGTIAPITAVQFGAYQAFQKAIAKATGVEGSQAGQIAAAAAGGACSAVISGPAELVMIQQQKHGGGLGETAARLFRERGLAGMYRGVSMAAARETLYTGGYLGVVPVLYETLRAAPWMADYPASTPLIVSGITGGLFAAIASQPPDTIKTRLQAFVDPEAKPEYRTVRSTVRDAIAKNGVGSLWSGFVPRAVRVVGAAFILNGCRTKLEETVLRYKAKDAKMA